jgi:cytochrome c oxidase subunit 4
MSAARVSPRSTFATWAALVLLAATSFLLSMIHLGSFVVPVAIGIAAIKAALVAIVFMELAIQRASNRIAFVSAIVFITLLAGLTVVDVATRAREPVSMPEQGSVR